MGRTDISSINRKACDQLSSKFSFIPALNNYLKKNLPYSIIEHLAIFNSCSIHFAA